MVASLRTKRLAIALGVVAFLGLVKLGGPFRTIRRGRRQERASNAIELWRFAVLPIQCFNVQRSLSQM